MHYYRHNIGDYRRDTVHLTLLEHGIYRQFLDSYYLSESPLCADHAKLMRTHCIRTADELQAAENVLAEFFIATENGYIHKRCDAEIAEFHGKSTKAAESAKQRWNKNKDLTNNANAMRTHSERNANGMLTNNHKPITNNQKPINNTEAPEGVKESKDKKEVASIPEGVSEDVWETFLAQRKLSRAVVTNRVINTISKEAAKANWTLEDALTECAARGWRGFKAEWVTAKHDESLDNYFDEVK